MNKKRILLCAIVLLTSLCVTTSSVNSSVQQTINDQVNVLPGTHSWMETLADSRTVSDNQTIILKNPTFEELKNFVLTDDTHRHQFIPYEYECRNFATDMVNNAVQKGIQAGFVLICYPQWQHAAVAFKTIDRGLIYIEPQTNAAIDIKVGGRYQDQEIKQILIAW